MVGVYGVRAYSACALPTYPKHTNVRAEIHRQTEACVFEGYIALLWTTYVTQAGPPATEACSLSTHVGNAVEAFDVRINAVEFRGGKCAFRAQTVVSRI